MTLVHAWYINAFPVNGCGYSPLPGLFTVPPIITEITGTPAIEGTNVTLKCLAKGKPTPSIRWARLFDNLTVTMPLINIRREDAPAYRCTAHNGVGTSAFKDVSIDVLCECCQKVILELICTCVDMQCVCVYHVHAVLIYFHDTKLVFS